MSNDPAVWTILVVLAAFGAGYALVSWLVSRWKRPLPLVPPPPAGGDGAPPARAETTAAWRDQSRQQAEAFRRRQEVQRADAWEQLRTPAAAGQTGVPRAEVKDEAHYRTVLGLRGAPTFAEIEARYRSLAAQYHPDQVRHLGPKLQALAAQELAAITAAYEYFRQRQV